MLRTQLVGPDGSFSMGLRHLFPLSSPPRARAWALNPFGPCRGRALPSHIPAHAVRLNDTKTTRPNTEYSPNTFKALRFAAPRSRNTKSASQALSGPHRCPVPHRRPGGPLPGAGTPSARKLYVPPTEHGWKRPGKAASSAACGGAGVHAWRGAGRQTEQGFRGLLRTGVARCRQGPLLRCGLAMASMIQALPLAMQPAAPPMAGCSTVHKQQVARKSWFERKEHDSASHTC